MIPAVYGSARTPVRRVENSAWTEVNRRPANSIQSIVPRWTVRRPSPPSASIGTVSRPSRRPRRWTQGLLNTTGQVDYADPADATDTAQATAAVDPVSVVFETRTGSIVDGVQIGLVDAASGAPAVVYGNDGISVFPSAIASGSTVTDASGASYSFGPGEYRFPVVPDGDYRLVVTPPTDFAAPSTASIADLQLLPRAPYDLGPASFGNTFTHSGAPIFNWDIPVDPQATALFLEKRTLTTVAAPGDFVRYELAL